jgi:hypothetical protein
MATWSTVVGRVAQIEGIADSIYRNALIEFEEEDSDFSSCRSFYIAFYGYLLLSGRIYVIFGTLAMKVAPSRRLELFIPVYIIFII